MAERNRRRSRRQPERRRSSRRPLATSKSGEKIKAELDDLLDEIDDVLEENAEDFVKSLRAERRRVTTSCVVDSYLSHPLSTLGA